MPFRTNTALALVAAAATLGGASSAAAAATPVVGCRQHVEPSIPRFDPARDIVRGTFALVTVRRDLPRLSQASYRPRNGRSAGIKLPIGLHAGRRATLSVPAAHRDHVGLVYRQTARTATRPRQADGAVTFASCPAGTPAFSSDGIVGPVTGWAGALIVSGPRCVRLEVRIDGRRQRDIRLPLGRRCT